MTAQEDVAFFSQAEIAFGVLGAQDGFMLVPLTDDTGVSDASAQAKAKGFWFCGLLALTKSGEPAVRCEPDAESIGVMALASAHFIRQMAHRLVPEGKGDTVDWLKGLWSLEDNRAG